MFFYDEHQPSKWNPETSPQRIAKFGRQHVILYAELTHIALQNCDFHRLGWHPSKFYPKHHLFVHLSEEACSSGNPREFWCYWDDSAIGDVVAVAEASHAKYVHRSVMEKKRFQW